jgi:hypothetical protein
VIQWVQIGEFQDKLSKTWQLWALESSERVLYEVREDWDHSPVGGAVIDSQSRNLWVVEEYRRRGIATAIYDLIERRNGERFEPSARLTELGKIFWVARKKKLAIYENSCKLLLHGEEAEDV